MFDVHSIYKMENIFANLLLLLMMKKFLIFGTAFPGEEPYSVEHDLSFFVKDDKTGLYDRFDEFHYQRTYTIAQYTEWLQQADFEVLEVLADLEDEPVKAETERILFVVQKKQ